MPDKIKCHVHLDELYPVPFVETKSPYGAWTNPQPTIELDMEDILEHEKALQVYLVARKKFLGIVREAEKING